MGPDILGRACIVNRTLGGPYPIALVLGSRFPDTVTD